MFGFIPFIESFFLLSLGITFILIFLMVFHFKQRIEILEKKNNNLSDLSNKIVKEITNLHTVYLQNQHPSPKHNFINPKEHICENIRITTSIPIPIDNNNNNNNDFVENGPYKKIVVMDTIVNDEYLSFESSDSEYEYDSELDSETESICLEELEIPPIKEEIHLIQLNNESYESNVDDLEREIIIVHKEESVLETVVESGLEVDTKNNQINYQKMNVSQLRILAISKGLCSDTSKIKRADLIKLLESSEI